MTSPMIEGTSGPEYSEYKQNGREMETKTPAHK